MTRGRPGRPLRRRPNSTERLELLIFVEGERTEDEYLTYWHRLHRERVIVTIDPFHGDPLALVEQAIKAKERESREQRRGRGKAHDQFWCVFDRDDHQRYHQAVQRAQEGGICVAFSNPCIELWFLLHFCDQTAYIERGAVQRESSQHLKCAGKALSPDALDAMATAYPDAKRRAQDLVRWHEGNGSRPGENPSTSMWKLIEVIRGDGQQQC